MLLLLAILRAPTCTVATGSVVLSGLPAGTWTVRRTPGGVDTTGTGTTVTITGIPSGTYNFSVRNSSNCVSPPSEDVVNTGNTFSPSGTCCRIDCSAYLCGFNRKCNFERIAPAGSWTLTRSPDGIQRIGSGTSITIAGLPDGVTYYFYRFQFNGMCISVFRRRCNNSSARNSHVLPKVGKITAPTCTLATGSVIFTDLPATGIWTLTRYPGAVKTTGTGDN